jgi:hypothetical protein
MAMLPEADVQRLVAEANERQQELTSAAVQRLGRGVQRRRRQHHYGGEEYVVILERFENFLQPGRQEYEYLSSVGWDRERAEHLRAALVTLRVRVGEAIEDLDRVISGEAELKEGARIAALGREIGLWP